MSKYDDDTRAIQRISLVIAILALTVYLVLAIWTHTFIPGRYFGIHS